MRYLHCAFIFLLALLLACQQEQRSLEKAGAAVSGIDSLEAVQEEPQRKESSPGADTLSFEVAFSRFFQALQTEDTVALNQFIDPQQGFWLIEQPGAVPAYTHYSSIQEVKRSYQNLPFVSITQQMQACALQEREEFPEFDCAWMDQGRTGYAEDGCFYTTATSFRNTDMWQYANLSEQQEENVQQMQQQVQQVVLHTPSSYRFYFMHDGAHWRLLFADLRVPCSA